MKLIEYLQKCLKICQFYVVKMEEKSCLQDKLLLNDYLFGDL